MILLWLLAKYDISLLYVYSLPVFIKIKSIKSQMSIFMKAKHRMPSSYDQYKHPSTNSLLAVEAKEPSICYIWIPTTPPNVELFMLKYLLMFPFLFLSHPKRKVKHMLAKC
ncbi:hypothetical protein EYC84_008560 [Monilinia fructicola]|uniref:Uncharacterized protein n=1 Tax=Monilinia fructicola TaxID=38448 RepID=A0A5M9JM91_MONFR|nr:hypothetical protein EYC84_008560 [Monilinia fructicola]